MSNIKNNNITCEKNESYDYNNEEENCDVETETHTNKNIKKSSIK